MQLFEHWDCGLWTVDCGLGLWTGRSATAHPFKRRRLFPKVHYCLPLKLSFCHGANSARIIRFGTMRPVHRPFWPVAKSPIACCTHVSVGNLPIGGIPIHVHVLAIRPQTVRSGGGGGVGDGDGTTSAGFSLPRAPGDTC